MEYNFHLPLRPSPLSQPEHHHFFYVSNHGRLDKDKQEAKDKRRKISQHNTTVNENYSDKQQQPVIDDAVPPELTAVLSSFSLFKTAPTSFFKDLTKKLRLVQYHPQEYIVREKETAKAMYWILRGSVGVVSMDGESIYAELAAGSFFGEIGILFHRPRTATVVARTKVLLGILTKDALYQVLPGYPQIERIIRDEAQERLAVQEKKKRAGVRSFTTSITPAVFPSISGVMASDNALDNSPIPGPNLPPLRSILNTERSLAEGHLDLVDRSFSIQRFLKHLPVFDNLPSDIIHDLALAVELKKIEAMNFVFKKHDTGCDIYFIISGEVEVLDSKFDRVLARLSTPSYFGEMSFLSLNDSNSPNLQPTRSADIRAISNTQLLVVPGTKLTQIIENYPSIKEEMQRTARERKIRNYSITAGSPLEHLVKEAKTGKLSEILNNSYDDDRDDVLPILQPVFKKNFGWNEWNDGKSNRKTPSPSRSPSPGGMLLSPSPRAISPNTSVQYPVADYNTPRMNPVLPSINTFRSHKTPTFQYTPHAHRMRLNSVNAGRRHSVINSNMGPFPESILLFIMDLMPLDELMKCASVCVKWKQLSYLSDKLCRVLDLTPWNTLMDDEILAKITKFVGSRPTHIDISNCYHITDEGFSNLINEVGIRGSITTLNMKNCWNISAMAIMDLTVPSVGHNLTSIDLSNCRKVRDVVVERLVGHNGRKNPQASLSTYADNSPSFGCPKLEHLNLGYCKYLTDKSMLHLSENASDILKSLDLTRCTSITDNGFSFWSETLFSKLTTLVLKDCTFLTDNSIISLASSCPNLEQLDLTFCCVITDASLYVIQQNFPLLTDLNLSFCGSAVSDNSLIALSKLEHLSNLKIKGCIRVTRQGIDMLLSNSLSINDLDISQCPYSNTYMGKKLEPFKKSAGRYVYLKVAPSDRIIRVEL
ncbi:hypothetical protein PP7435_CHR2-0237 [Komagataella phaffii CBS 7435]|uniref:Cyclic nucleotide-binding domain-containing protein n=2 Tax=Komagataella phaffii TaxID=460519 RepID=C4R2G7_KOMPG|nr:Hypothetical protein PAS_chr2-2_0226 [Komagataella phaffii GS115]AOA61970.1 GQ67_01110T0 [Komagataella phaffii]CAH2447756.1 hypothetical protein BQ9382_C2-1305 [Komagataella phaffii CBS 7435]AOA67242.1 GQ68_00279T0 [Komagataella phaffii GS115]CAY69691.1 Hypothetical protein PAS_chr2-2_0226 [Komagataella phaffii GS115]CCA37933.1 hypothetical protein PP7435_CHR2-0237 [Komagataella phaffii CBS 7435]